MLRSLPRSMPGAIRLMVAQCRQMQKRSVNTKTPPPQLPQPKAHLLRPAVWAALTAAGGAAIYVGHDAAVQTRRSQAPTRVTVGHDWSDSEVRQRLGLFVDTLRKIDAVELHWWSPTTARVVGQYLEGDIRVREGWVDVTMRVHGPLRVRSQSLHGWMVQNLRDKLEV